MTTEEIVKRAKSWRFHPQTGWKVLEPPVSLYLTTGEEVKVIEVDDKHYRHDRVLIAYGGCLIWKDASDLMTEAPKKR